MTLQSSLMQQIHADGSVRHAEKRRNGSCQFANGIARISLDAYENVVPKSYRNVNKQTCVAAVVAQREGELQVMGLGVGTKFLSDAILREEQLRGTIAADGDGSSYGKRIRDCHAEVLARRAFRRQISLEILFDLAAAEENGKGKTTNYIPILERIENKDFGGDDKKSNITNNIRYRLRSDVTLHFYASSAPCGNATLKKFTKMEKEKFDESLGPDEWPKQIHTPIQAHSLRLGQFTLLVKKDGSIKTEEPKKDTSISAETVKIGDSDIPEQSQKKRRKQWPCTESDTWCPPSCSITRFNKGTIHSCSDKLCRWNCLGMQGSLLSSVLEEPLYMTTLTVGRKFTRAICQRAVCCRADGYAISKIDNADASNNSYKLNHPTLMETNVYMDDAGTHDMTGIKLLGQDAKFQSNLCWVWWPEKSAEFGYEADCIDGTTGLKINFHQESTGTTVDGHISTSSTSYSDCSTHALIQLNLEILQTAGVSSKNIPQKSQCKLSLSDVRLLKQQVSPQYESAKAELFRHRVFRQWSCRYPK